MPIGLRKQKGVTLMEAIVFLVVIGIAFSALMSVFSNSVVGNKSITPVVRAKALEIAQAQLDEILSRKFDENTPTGGVPACGSTGAVACLGIVPDSDFDDVGDYQGFSTLAAPGYPVSVTVVNAGADLGLAADQAKLVTVSVGMPAGSDRLTLSAYRANF